jgi:hypothetical protein
MSITSDFIRHLKFFLVLQADDIRRLKTSSFMANVEFPDGIKGVSGTLCKHTVKTRNGVITRRIVATYSKRTGKQRIYFRESKPRTTPVSDGEKQRRLLFARASACASQVIADKTSPAFREWRERFERTRGRFNGKKYSTLKGFIMAVMYAELN